MERLVMLRAAFDTGFVSALALALFVQLLHTVFG